MSILTLAQDAVNRAGLQSISSVTTATVDLSRQVKAFLELEGMEARDSHPWPELQKPFQVTLVDSQATYALPVDFNSMIHETMWNQDQDWPVIGPLTPQEYRMRVEGITVEPVYERYRIRGFDNTTGELIIWPFPDADDAGQVIIFDYYTTNWLRPPNRWVTATVYAASAYVYYGQNIYQTTAGGTSGATAPTHQAGSVSDGGVTWTFVKYEKIQGDTDVPVIDERSLSLGLEWRLRQAKDLQWETVYKDAKLRLLERAQAKTGAKTISFCSYAEPLLLSTANIPDTDYGG